jgi:hypothetical protein
MADRRQLVETKELKTKQIQSFLVEQKPVSFFFDPEVDALMILFNDPCKETIVHFIDDQVALLYEPETLEVVGVQVEAFQKAFLVEHDSVARAWKLREKCSELEDFGEMIIAVERQKPIVAREIVQITDEILRPRGGPRRRELVPA